MKILVINTCVREKLVLDSLNWTLRWLYSIDFDSISVLCKSLRSSLDLKKKSPETKTRASFISRPLDEIKYYHTVFIKVCICAKHQRTTSINYS